MAAADKKHAQFESEIKKIVDKWVPVLLLQKHTFEVRHDKPKDKNKYYGFLFSYPYLNQTIVYSEDAFNEWNKDKENIEPFILHELVHAVTDPLYSKAVQRCVSKDEIEDEREGLTDHICNILLKHERAIKEVDDGCKRN